MLIKATRIRAVSGADALARHLLHGDDNEETVVLRGSVGDLHDAVDDARRYGRVYALRHFVVAPAIPLDRSQLEQAVQALGTEFGFDPALVLVVEHQKARAVAHAADRHWHIVAAETHAATGRVLSSSFSHARHEKLSRILELLFDHPIVRGAHDRAVLAALRAEGKTELADRLHAALTLGGRPIAAFSSEQHQAAKRAGIDLAIVREAVRAACADAPNAAVLNHRLATHGLTVVPGDKTGVWVLRGPEGQFLGAAHRLSGLTKADFQIIMETDHDHHHFESANHGATDPERHTKTAAGRGDHPSTGAGNGLADGRRVDVSAGRGDRSFANHGAAAGSGGRELAGNASEARSARHRSRAAPDAGRGLTSAVADIGRGLLELARSVSTASPAEQTRQHLAEQEQALRARLAATEVNCDQGVSKRLYTARAYRDSAAARHTAALRDYRAAQERWAAAPEPRRGILDKLLGRQIVPHSINALERDVAVARDALISAERSISSAEANLSRVEKAEAEDRRRLMGEAEEQRRRAMERLGEIITAQQVVKTYPMIVYSGPGFATWVGGKIERKRRRGLRNPFAVNIWGLPIDPGY